MVEVSQKILDLQESKLRENKLLARISIVVTLFRLATVPICNAVYAFVLCLLILPLLDRVSG